MTGHYRNGGKMSFSERIYRTPALYVVSLFVAAALALFLLVTLIFFICGGGAFTNEIDGVTYKYFGLSNDGVPTLGTFKCSDGSGGSVSGGKVRFKDGSVYEGGLSGLSFEGQGSFTDVYGNKHVGTFKDGKQTGGGFVYYADGGKFAGQFENGKFHGYGEITYADGSVYKGYFREGEKSGYGEMTYADGGVYKGYFERDMRHGEGEYRFAGGDSYTGKFKYNLMDGFGTYFFTSGRVFVGEFVAGVPQA